MKRMKLWSIMMLVVMALPMMVACGGSDDETSVRDQLVGIWESNMLSSCWKCFKLEADGTVVYDLHPKYNDNGILENYHHHIASWVYIEEEKTIKMYTDDQYYSYTLKVDMSESGNSWTGYKRNNKGELDIYNFTRLHGNFEIIVR